LSNDELIGQVGRVPKYQLENSINEHRNSLMYEEQYWNQQLFEHDKLTTKMTGLPIEHQMALYGAAHAALDVVGTWQIFFANIDKEMQWVREYNQKNVVTRFFKCAFDSRQYH